MSSVKEYPQLTIGEGLIDPATRVANGEITEQEIDEFCEALASDEFYTEVSGIIPRKCVDGRSRADGQQELGPNAAGGTNSLVVADALTHNSYRLPGEKAPQHAERLFGELKKRGHKLGNHDDDQAQAPNCGCGACDKLDTQYPMQPSILGYIARRGDDVRSIVTALGVEVSEATHELILGNATALIDQEYATNGAEMRDVMVKTEGDAAVETLTGPHNEIGVIPQRAFGKTLDRAKLKARFGDKLQVFNVDIWALEAATKEISLSAEEAHEKFVAALYYNVATAAVLGGPSLRVIA